MRADAALQVGQAQHRFQRTTGCLAALPDGALCVLAYLVEFRRIDTAQTEFFYTHAETIAVHDNDFLTSSNHWCRDFIGIAKKPSRSEYREQQRP